MEEKNMYFSTSVDCELHSFLIVAMQENLWSNCTCHAVDTVESESTGMGDVRIIIN